MKTTKEFADKHGHEPAGCCLLGRCGKEAKADAWEIEHAKPKPYLVQAGDLVKFTPQWCGPGEQDEVSLVLVANDDENRVDITSAEPSDGFLKPWSTVDRRMITPVEVPPAGEKVIRYVATKLIERLPKEWVKYAADPARGEYRGFAALHDKCDANMLLPNAEISDIQSDEWLSFYNRTMHDVTAILIVWHDQQQQQKRVRVRRVNR